MIPGCDECTGAGKTCTVHRFMAALDTAVTDTANSLFAETGTPVDPMLLLNALLCEAENFTRYAIRADGVAPTLRWCARYFAERAQAEDGETVH